MTVELPPFNIGNGWTPILNKLIADIREIEPNAKFVQIKQKFGGLRAYVDMENISEDNREEIRELIIRAETESYKTCEICGNNAEPIVDDHGWWVTRCGECHE